MSFPFVQPYFGLGNSLQTAQAGGAGGAVGGWVELGRTTLGSVNDYVQVSSLPDKRYYMVLSDVVGNGSGVNFLKRVGNSGIDTGSNYATRYSTNGGADGTQTSKTYFTFAFGGVGTNPTFSVDYLANLSNKEKLMISHLNHQATAGAGTAPSRGEIVGKWANTTNPITDIAAFNSGSSDWAVGSEVVVLGWDPADTHTSNFWEELADISTTSGGTISSGTITAKKYLWVQAFLKKSSASFTKMQFNNDTANNYAVRREGNGGGDNTDTSFDSIYNHIYSTDDNVFLNSFIINNSANEKLVINHAVGDGDVGAANDPDRSETVGKWANTSNQITEIDIIGNNTTGSILKVWGSD